MQSVRSGRSGTRPRRRPRDPSLVSTRYCCPICGGDHPRPEHALDDGRQYVPLDPAELRQLRQAALEEFPQAVRASAGAEHLEHLAALVGAIDARLGRLDG